MYKNYNMNQVVLPMNIEMKLKETDIAFHIHHLVESIPSEAFAPFYKATGCPSYHPKMMLKIILCSYTQSVFSGRRIEDLTKDSVRMMWLTQGYEPSYRTINRFRIHPQMQELLKQCFVQFRCQLIEEKCIDQQAIFIDGTAEPLKAIQHLMTRPLKIKREVDKINNNIDKILITTDDDVIRHQEEQFLKTGFKVVEWQNEIDKVKKSKKRLKN